MSLEEKNSGSGQPHPGAGPRFWCASHEELARFSALRRRDRPGIRSTLSFQSAAAREGPLRGAFSHANVWAEVSQTSLERTGNHRRPRKVHMRYKDSEGITPIFCVSIVRGIAESLDEAAPEPCPPALADTLDGAVVNEYLDRFAEEMGWDAK